MRKSPCKHKTLQWNCMDVHQLCCWHKSEEKKGMGSLEKRDRLQHAPLPLEQHSATSPPHSSPFPSIFPPPTDYLLLTARHLSFPSVGTDVHSSVSICKTIYSDHKANPAIGMQHLVMRRGDKIRPLIHFHPSKYLLDLCIH